MAIFLFLLLFSAVNAVSAQQKLSDISLGSSLTPTTNSSWLSPSGLYAFGFFQQNNGYAVGIFVAGIPEKTVVWTPNMDNLTVSNDVSLQLTRDGRLILWQRERPDVEVADPSTPIASASMLDNGNFVLYGSDSRIIWQSFDHPTDTLLPGQRLSPGQQLFSRAPENNHTRGRFRLKMQFDGNLVQYPADTPDNSQHAYYASNTDVIGTNVSLNLDNDGYLYLVNGNSILLNITRGGFPTEGTMYLLRIDVDGILRLYSRSLSREGNWTTIWSSVEDKCVPKGVCGMNSFCILMDEIVNCECLPGFRYLHWGNWAAGCTRNSVSPGCGDDARVKYEIRTVENTVWEDNVYASLDTGTAENCTEACLDDCNCEAAFFNGYRCTKQKLPLMYGRRSWNDSDIALIKVSTVTSTPDTGGVSGDSVKEIKKELRLDTWALAFHFLLWSLFNSNFCDLRLLENFGL